VLFCERSLSLNNRSNSETIVSLCAFRILKGVITIYKIPLALLFICAILSCSKFIVPKKEGTWQKQERQNVPPKLPRGKSARMLQPENQNSAQLTRKNNVRL
jgi:hypothetical protein